MRGRNRPIPRGFSHRGFSLIELLIVMAVLGILAGIAIPNLANAIYKANAADVLGDLNAVRVAYHQYLADGGVTAPSSAYGIVPPYMEPYLPGGFTFDTDVADYRWVRVPPAASPWGVEMGAFRVKPKANVRQPILDQLEAMAHDEFSVVGADNILYYLMPLESGQD